MKTSNCCDAFVNPDLMICSDCKEHCEFGEEETPEWVKEKCNHIFNEVLLCNPPKYVCSKCGVLENDIIKLIQNK